MHEVQRWRRLSPGRRTAAASSFPGARGKVFPRPERTQRWHRGCPCNNQDVRLTGFLFGRIPLGAATPAHNAKNTARARLPKQRPSLCLLRDHNSPSFIETRTHNVSLAKKSTHPHTPNTKSTHTDTNTHTPNHKSKHNTQTHQTPTHETQHLHTQTHKIQLHQR